jgi:hypothetical protein
MSRSQKRRGKFPLAIICAPTRNKSDVCMSDKNYFNGIENFPRWDEIYKIFDIEYFLAEDEDIVVYHNINKINIY